MVAPFGTEPVPSRKKKFVADLRRTLNGSLKNFKSLRNKVRRNYEKSNPSLYILSLILTWLSSSSSHRASRWVSDDPTMPCTRSPISRCSLQARRSRFSKLLSLLRSEQNLKVFLITVWWNNFKQYSKLNYQILNFASS